MNALKTGIDAQSQLIRGETQTALSELTAEYYDQFHPTTPVERMLVDTLIDCEWLIRRFRAIDTQLTENAWHVFDITLGKVFTDHCDVFARLQRRIDSTQRHYHNALHELQKLQSCEKLQSRDREEALPSEPEPDPATPRIQTPNPENGFVPPSLSAEPRDASPETQPLKI